jgi:hypothetical protein
MHQEWGMHIGGGAVLAGTLLLGAVLVPVRAEATPSPPAHKVTICHRTDSVTNPYTVNPVDISSTDGSLGTGSNDHTHHLGPAFDYTADPNVAYPPPRNGDQWGDIIPPYQWGETPEESFPGMNWDATGQAIWEAGCTLPAPTTTATTAAPVTTAAPTTTTTQATTSTTEATTSTTAAVLPVTIEPTTSTQAATPPTGGSQVLGETVTRNALAVTGGEVVVLSTLGAGLVGLGLALMVATKRRLHALG